MSIPALIELSAPNGKKITAALRRDGSTCPVTCRFMRANGDPTFIYEFAEGDMAQVPSGDDNFRLIDEAGGLWPRGEVEWASMPPVR